MNKRGGGPWKAVRNRLAGGGNKYVKLGLFFVEFEPCVHCFRVPVAGRTSMVVNVDSLLKFFVFLERRIRKNVQDKETNSNRGTRWNHWQ